MAFTFFFVRSGLTTNIGLTSFAANIMEENEGEIRIHVL